MRNKHGLIKEGSLHVLPLSVAGQTECVLNSTCIHVCIQHTVEPPDKGHFGDNLNSADLFFVKRFSSLGGSECFVGVILGP